MEELSSFYSNLYHEKPSNEILMDSFVEMVSIPKLTKAQKKKCEEKLTVNERYNSLRSFQKNKTPGNDGLTLEFYLVFWPILGKHLVECYNYAHEHGELSNTQRQAVITLLEKRIKTRD